MAQPRYTQIDIEATADYHVISRCVRRAFLCRYDRATARHFDHRKTWVLEKLAECGLIPRVARPRLNVGGGRLPIRG